MAERLEYHLLCAKWTTTEKRLRLAITVSAAVRPQQDRIRVFVFFPHFTVILRVDFRYIQRPFLLFHTGEIRALVINYEADIIHRKYSTGNLLTALLFGSSGIVSWSRTVDGKARVCFFLCRRGQRAEHVTQAILGEVMPAPTADSEPPVPQADSTNTANSKDAEVVRDSSDAEDSEESGIDEDEGEDDDREACEEVQGSGDEAAPDGAQAGKFMPGGESLRAA